MFFYCINRAFKWLCLKTRQTCQNGQHVHRFQVRTPICHIVRGQKLNPNIFFSNFSGASGISRQIAGISRQKSLIPWVPRDIPNFLAPTPSPGRPPPHQKISGLKSLGLGSFFVPELYVFHAPTGFGVGVRRSGFY